MRLLGTHRHAKVSGIAAQGLGDLGDALYETWFTQPTRTYYVGGKSFTVSATRVRMGSNPKVITYANVYRTLDIIYDALLNLSTPTTYRDFAGAPTYGALPDKNIVLFGNDPWPNPTPQPHFTVLADGTRILSIGSPTSARDPVEFLRAAVTSRDWVAVGYWFSFWANSIYKATGVLLDPWHGLSQVNVAEYYYTNDGGHHAFTFDDYDVGAFCREVWRKFLPWQNNSHSYEIAGLGYPGTTPSEIGAYSPHADMVDFAFSWFNYTDYANGSGYAGANKNLLRIGWVPDSSKTFGDYVGTIVTAIGLAVITWGAATALGAAGGGAGGAGAGGTTGSTTGGVIGTGSIVGTTGGGIVAAPLTLETGLLEEVVVTAAAPSISAGTVASVAAGLGAGAIVATAVPPPISAPPISAPTISPAPAPAAGDLLPEVVVTGAAPGTGVSAGTIGAALAAGAVSATTVAPAISANTTATPPDNALPSNDMLDEVTVTAKPPAPIPGLDLAAALGAGTEIIPTVPGVSLDAPSLNSPGNSLSDKLQALVTKYGLAYVKAHLGELLSKLLGHSPTQQEIMDANSQLNEGSTMTPWLLGGGFLLVLAVLATTGGKK